MESSFIPYTSHSLTQSDIDCVSEVLKGQAITCGPAVSKFEQDLCEAVGCRFAISCSSGTAALHAAYGSLDLGSEDCIFVPSITFAATANAALYIGAKVIFVDCDPVTGCMSVASLENAVDLAIKKKWTPKVVVPVHFGGLNADMDLIFAIASKYQIHVVEDASHGVGASYSDSSGRSFKIGNHPNSSMACFSFHGAKHIGVGEGGAVVTNDPTLAAKVRLFVTHGITKDRSKYCQNHEYHKNPWYHEMQSLGYNYRLSDINATLGSSQLKRLDQNINNRQSIAEIYRRKLKDLSQITLCAEAQKGSVHGYHLFYIRILDPCFNKIDLVSFLNKQGIGTQVHYLPVQKHPFYNNNRDSWAEVDCVNSLTHYEQMLSIPMFHSLDLKKASFIADQIINFFENRKG